MTQSLGTKYRRTRNLVAVSNNELRFLKQLRSHWRDSGGQYSFVAAISHHEIGRSRLAPLPWNAYPGIGGYHAEINLLTNYDIKGRVVYVSGWRTCNGNRVKNTAPCDDCLVGLEQARARAVVYWWHQSPVKEYL